MPLLPSLAEFGSDRICGNRIYARPMLVEHAGIVGRVRRRPL